VPIAGIVALKPFSPDAGLSAAPVDDGVGVEAAVAFDDAPIARSGWKYGQLGQVLRSGISEPKSGQLPLLG
jgi:hypothetical protein